MTKSEAVGTGLISCTAAGACYLTAAPSPGGQHGYGALCFSPSTGLLVVIAAFPEVQTPQGVSLGSTYAQMYAAYPDWSHVPQPNSPTDGRGGAKVPGNPAAHYRINVQSGVVIELSLDANNQDCYE